MDIAVAGGRIVGVRGRPGDRVNRGRLGPKDLYGWQANHAEDRLTTPLIREDGRLVACDWDTAMDRITARTRTLLAERGPGSVGFYTTGQLFLEEYYTLTVIGRTGVGTPHLDGNTRLCTATAGEALKETFGCDGQPASYADVDHADVIALFGHNLAETQPVQWMRILDRLEGRDPPRLVCVDPRPTLVARHAAVHLAPRGGTNVALLDTLLHEIIRTDRVDHDFVAAHTVGYDELAARVADCTPAWAAGICDVPARRISEAAELIGGGQPRRHGHPVGLDHCLGLRHPVGRPRRRRRSISGIPIVLRALHHGERELERDLVAAAEHHRTEHEFHHVALDVARWSHEHAERIARTAESHGLDLPGPSSNAASPGLLTTVREKTAEALGRRPETGLLLLHDLRRLHLAATGNSLDWEMLAQVAQATGADDLLELASACHPQTLRQMRWTNTLIKTHSPQLLTSAP